MNLYIEHQLQDLKKPLKNNDLKNSFEKEELKQQLQIYTENSMPSSEKIPEDI